MSAAAWLWFCSRSLKHLEHNPNVWGDPKKPHGHRVGWLLDSSILSCQDRQIPQSRTHNDIRCWWIRQPPTTSTI
jgi:hypothetical protein